MSLIFSAELAGSVSGSSEPECAPSPSARSIPTAAASSPSTGQLSLFSETSETLPAKLLPTPSAVSYGSNRGGGMGRVGPIRHSLDAMARKGLISSAVGSPARTYRSPERTRAFAASAAAYGRSTPELLARFDRATSSWRTSQRCLVEGWTLFSETWPRSGTMRSGTAYQLPPLVRLTDGIGSGSWPTPGAADNRDRGNLSMPSIQRRASLGKQLNLGMVVDPTSGALNPTWVEWLMGFPPGWTDCGRSGMPSSRKSRS